MRFRTAITLTILLALAAALLATVAVVSVVLERAARRELTAELARDRDALVDMLRYRSSLHRAESRVLADEPRLKAVVSTEDVTSATILGVLSDLRRALRCDLLLITDRWESGRQSGHCRSPGKWGIRRCLERWCAGVCGTRAATLFWGNDGWGGGGWLSHG